MGVHSGGRRNPGHTPKSLCGVLLPTQHCMLRWVFGGVGAFSCNRECALLRTIEAVGACPSFRAQDAAPRTLPILKGCHE